MVKNITADEERAIIESTERGEWTVDGAIEEQRAAWQASAQALIAGQRRRISLSIPERDLMLLKARAQEEGIPYQALINSILHKYVERR